MDFWHRLWKRKRPPPPERKAPRWGIHRDKAREVGSVVYYAEGRVKQFSHLRTFRITVRRRQSGSVLELSPQARSCLEFILQSERRQPKKNSATKLFCRTPGYGIEVIAIDTHGKRIDLCTVGFCLHEDYLDSKTVARQMADFVRVQLEDQEWDLSHFFDHSGTGSKLLIMSALLSSYHNVVSGWNQ